MAKKEKKQEGRKDRRGWKIRQTGKSRTRFFSLRIPFPTRFFERGSVASTDCFFQSCSQGARVTGKLIYYRVTVFPRTVFARISIHGATKTVRPARTTQSGRARCGWLLQRGRIVCSHNNQHWLCARPRVVVAHRTPQCQIDARAYTCVCTDVTHAETSSEGFVRENSRRNLE